MTHSSSPPARVGILLSGRGSNFLALHAAMERGEVPARVALVLSNLPGAAGLARAQELGLRTACVLAADHPDRAAQEQAMIAALREAGVEWICLAGFMRLLSAVFVDAFPNAVLNVHPSLLPAFPGVDAQRQALEHGVKITGATVHLVTPELDAGPIVLQAAVPIEAGDTVETLSDRILVQEHRLYPEALQVLLTPGWRIDGRRFVAASKQGAVFE